MEIIAYEMKYMKDDIEKIMSCVFHLSGNIFNNIRKYIIIAFMK